MSLVIFLLALGAALRLTRLAVSDQITQSFRTFLGLQYAAASALESQREREAQLDAPANRMYGPAAVRSAARARKTWLWLVQLFECPWCIGFWISGPAAAAAISVSPANSNLGALPLWFAFPALWLTISYLVAVIYTAVFTLEEYEPNGNSH